MSTPETTRPTIACATPKADPSAGPDSLSGQSRCVTQASSAAEGQDSPQAKPGSATNRPAPAGSEASRSQTTSDAQWCAAAADDFPGGQGSGDTQACLAAGDQAPVPTIRPPASTAAASARDQVPPAANGRASPTHPPLLADKHLDRNAAILEDLEKVRIANENRLRLLVTPADQPDDDGVCRGMGWLPPGIAPGEKAVSRVMQAAEKHLREAQEDGRRVSVPRDWHEPVWSLCANILLPLRATEDAAVAGLEEAMRAHPLGAFAESVTGLGPKQFGRLLGIIGDPYVRYFRIGPDGEELPPAPRTEAQLRALCGHGDPKRKPFKGMTKDEAKALGNPAAKMRVHLIAESMVQAGVRKLPDFDDANGYDLAHRKAITPFGQVYLDARAMYADRVHDGECMNRRRISPNGCGTREHPEWGAPGSPWRNGHQHAAGLRLVGERFLDDLYGEAKRLHEMR